MPKKVSDNSVTGGENDNNFKLIPPESSGNEIYDTLVYQIENGVSYDEIREAMNLAVTNKFITEDEHFKLQAILGARERSRR